MFKNKRPTRLLDKDGKPVWCDCSDFPGPCDGAGWCRDKPSTPKRSGNESR